MGTIHSRIVFIKLHADKMMVIVSSLHQSSLFTEQARTRPIVFVTEYAYLSNEHQSNAIYPTVKHQTVYIVLALNATHAQSVRRGNLPPNYGPNHSNWTISNAIIHGFCELHEFVIID